MYILSNTVTNNDLQQINNQLKIFSIAQKVSAILAVIFLLLTVFLFWRWGIWQMLLERTGFAKKKSISQMQELNAATGRLVKSSGAKIAEQEFSGQLTGDRKKTKKARRTGEIKQTPESTPAPPQVTAEPVQEAVPETAVLADTPVQYNGKFILTMKQVVIHTDERIGGR